jgi:hypothetical protein
MMNSVMLARPQDLIMLSRPGCRGSRFVTKQTEQRIRQDTEDRGIKMHSRRFRRSNLEGKPHVDIELKKMESVERLKDFIFLGLAKHENASKDLCPNTETAIRERLKRTLRQARQEAVQALWALV